ncbi:hypothetical protein SAMN05519104_8198 [Rhizobiales bacterium GAS188]|nr:hypothetical protein SAMN05519104_8198 [Rhizobiales bacterium GAS188]
MSEQPAKKKIATAEQLATLNFEPFDVSGDLPSNTKWVEMGNPYLVTLRLASVVCSKPSPSSSPQLVSSMAKG